MLSWWLPESVSTYGPDIDRLFSGGESFFDQAGWYDRLARFLAETPRG